MHIAAAMGTPVVALFGPSGEMQWGPWGVPARVIASDAHPCRPCGLDGCGGGKVSDCLTTLPVERVHDGLRSLLAETGRESLMRLALIRQRYTPYGGAERFIEGALEALLERNVAITLYTREWPQTNLQLIEPHICDPFYLGNLWRDWGFARAVGRAVGTTKANLVQSHERVLCCDIYRAGDGVHAVWLEERLRGASALARLGVMLNPWHHYTLAHGEEALREPVAARRDLQFEDGARRDQGALRPPRRSPAGDLQRRGFRRVPSGALREHRERLRARYKIPAEATLFLLVGSGYERKGVATAIAALAELPASAHLMVVGREKHVNRYKRLARSLGVRDTNCLRRAAAGREALITARADVFVLPTIYDPFPNAALEAMACALPVITSHQVRRRRTRHRTRCRAGVRVARRGRPRRAHAHAA